MLKYHSERLSDQYNKGPLIEVKSLNLALACVNFKTQKLNKFYANNISNSCYGIFMLLLKTMFCL